MAGIKPEEWGLGSNWIWKGVMKMVMKTQKMNHKTLSAKPCMESCSDKQPKTTVKRTVKKTPAKKK
jgi:hypothetical protein